MHRVTLAVEAGRRPPSRAVYWLGTGSFQRGDGHVCGSLGLRRTVPGGVGFTFENRLQLFSTCAMVSNPEILRGPWIGTYLEANQKKHGLR
jgi:hypothetical protein